MWSWLKAKRCVGFPANSGQVVGVQRHDEDAADATAGIIEIRLVVVVDEDVHVERAVPSAATPGVFFPVADVGEGPQRIVGLEQRPVVAAHVERAVIFHDMRRDGDIGDALKRPVAEVIGNPRPAAGAIHVVLAAVADHSHVAGSGRPAGADHRQRIAIARRFARHRTSGPRRSGKGGADCEAEQEVRPSETGVTVFGAERISRQHRVPGSR